MVVTQPAGGGSPATDGGVSRGHRVTDSDAGVDARFDAGRARSGGAGRGKTFASIARAIPGCGALRVDPAAGLDGYPTVGTVPISPSVRIDDV